jgi:hypothetical protein
VVIPECALFGRALRRLCGLWRLGGYHWKMAEFKADLIAKVRYKLLLNARIVPGAAGGAAKITKFHDLYWRVSRSDAVRRHQSCGFFGGDATHIAPENQGTNGDDRNHNDSQNANPLQSQGLGLVL